MLGAHHDRDRSYTIEISGIINFCHKFELGGSQFIKPARFQNACIGNEQIDAAHCFYGLCDHIFTGRSIGDIHGETECAAFKFFRRFLRLRLVKIREHDRRAFRDQLPCDAEAESLRAARYYSQLACQTPLRGRTFIHSFLRVLCRFSKIQYYPFLSAV